MLKNESFSREQIIINKKGIFCTQLRLRLPVMIIVYTE